MARPTKLSPEVQQKICDAIRAGNYLETAAVLAGVDPSSFRRWRAKGREARTGVFCAFCAAVDQAEAEAEAELVKMWRSACPETWQAVRDLLARRHPERWGPRERKEVTGDRGGPVKIQFIEVPE